MRWKVTFQSYRGSQCTSYYVHSLDGGLIEGWRGIQLHRLCENMSGMCELLLTSRRAFIHVHSFERSRIRFKAEPPNRVSERVFLYEKELFMCTS